ncbi:MAG: nucleotidyltransferase family protein [Acidobacteriota bacterium]|nr:nucleotidyltransferase family protein [Acidobacteriota bacterium]
MTPPRGLQLVTQLPGSGYGDAATLYAAGLDRLGVPLTWWPIAKGLDTPSSLDRLPGLHPAIDERVLRLHHRPLDVDTLLIDVPPPRAHAHWLRKALDLTPYAYVAWEMDRLPDGWCDVLNGFERLFVPSEFNRSVLASEGITRPIEIVPHIAREVRRAPVPDALRAIENDDFVFYTIATWTPRKSMSDTLRAYLETFRADERVVLVVKTDSIVPGALEGDRVGRAVPHEQMTWWQVAKILAEYPGRGRVHLVAEEVSPRTIDGLHTRGDCFFGLPRSEGWGICPFEALLFGNPAILTGWGGQKDYLGDDWPLAVRYDLVEAPDEEYRTASGPPHWARADRAHASELLRWVFEHRGEARRIAAAKRGQLASDYASDRVCRRLAEGMGFAVEAAGSRPPLAADRFETTPVDSCIALLERACREFVSKATGGQPPPRPVDDLDRLVILAAAHRLQPVLSHLAHDGRLPFQVDAAVRDDWFGASCLTALHNGRRLDDLGRLLERCRELGLRPLAFKGPADIARFYGAPGLRPMVDLDLLCRPAELRALERELEALGYTERGRTAPHHVERHDPETGRSIELHFDLWDELSERPWLLEQTWDHATSCQAGGVRFEAPAPEHALILALGHLLHHDLAVTMRAVLDLALALERDDLIDADRLADCAHRCDVAEELALVTRALAGPLGWLAAEPAWLTAVPQRRDEALDRSVAVRLYRHWRRLPEWEGVSVLAELEARPDPRSRWGHLRRYLESPGGSALEGAAQVLSTAVRALRDGRRRGWRPGRELSLKRGVHLRRRG